MPHTLAIGNARADSRAFQQGTLTKGKLLKRLGRDDESYALFQDAIQNRWQHAMWRYSESLIDAGELAEASILEYERVIGKGDYAHFRADKEDFFIFITLLRLMKSDNPEASVVEQVLPALKESSTHPHAKNIAKAMCLVQDQEYAEAIELLKQVDIELTQNRADDQDSIVDEYCNTPLYLTAALLFQGEDIETARESYGEFLTRNKGNWKHIYDKSMRIVRDLEIDVKDKPQIQIITSQLLKSPIITNDEIKAQFSDAEIAGIYDLQAGSLAWGDQLDDAAQVRKFVMDNYFPQTLAGANCAMNWARYISWHDNDLEQAEAILRNILIDASYPDVIPWVKLELGNFALKKGQPQEAMNYVYEVLKLVDENAKGTVVRCRQDALVLQEKIVKTLQLMNEESEGVR